MSEEKIFIDGLIVKRSENAPDFVVCSLSVKVDALVPFLEKNQSDGWVNIQCKISKNGKYYAELDTWKPQKNQGEPAKSNSAPAGNSSAIIDFNDDIPF